MAAAAAEFRETVEIERRLKDNPAAEADWLNHQLAEAEMLDVTFAEVEEV